MDKGLHSSSHGATLPSDGTTSSTSHASTVAAETGTYATDTDFRMMESYIRGETSRSFRTFGLLVESSSTPLPTPCASPVCVLPEGNGLDGESESEEEEQWGWKGTPLTTDPSTTVSFMDTSWDQMAKVMPWPAQRSEVGGGGVTEIFLPGGRNEAQQVRSFTYTHRGRACSHLWCLLIMGQKDRYSLSGGI